MSLAIAFCNSYGIVAAADHMTTAISDGESFQCNSTAQKLFLSDEGYSFSFTGSASYRERPLSYWVEKLFPVFSKRGLSLSAYTLKLCQAFHFLDQSENTVVIGAGYSEGKPCLYSCDSLLTPDDHLKNSHSCIVYSGEVDIAKSVIDAAPIAHDNLTLTDMVDFVKHVILTVSNIQRFARTPVTVSPDCDILLMTKNVVKWIVPPYNDRL